MIRTHCNNLYLSDRKKHKDKDDKVWPNQNNAVIHQVKYQYNIKWTGISWRYTGSEEDYVHTLCRYCLCNVPTDHVTMSLEHYSDVIMGTMASQITRFTIVYSTVFQAQIKENIKVPRHTSLCAGNSPVTSEFPAHRANNAEHVSIWWRHHEEIPSVPLLSNHNFPTASATVSSEGDYFRLRLPSWWRHQTETFSALLAICAGNSSVPGEFPAQRPVTRSFDIFFDLRPNKRLSKQ